MGLVKGVQELQWISRHVYSFVYFASNNEVTAQMGEINNISIKYLQVNIRHRLDLKTQ